MDDIAIIHEEVYQYLKAKHKINPDFIFIPRKINNKDRFKKGFWFIGDDYYLQLSFWNGSDTLRRIHNIGFSIKHNGESIIDLSAKIQPSLVPFFTEVMNNIGGFKEWGGSSVRRWYKQNITRNYLQELDFFINNYKEIIDNLVRSIQPNGITFLPYNKFENYIKNIEGYRNEPTNKEIEKNIKLELNDKVNYEYDGLKLYSPTEMKFVIATHGKIINKLIELLQRKQIRLSNDNHRDLCLLNEKNEVNILFELKTDLSNSSIYSAIGQLLVYSNNIEPPPRLVMLLPKRLHEDFENIIEKLGLEVLYYYFDNNKEVLEIENIEEFIFKQ